ncbi:hypothetical protein C8R46DRAFT_950452 [Mycena filopes]|nr:hypothetical protein C8R46DRAFT_950452 [Mycena filopes]
MHDALQIPEVLSLIFDPLGTRTRALHSKVTLDDAALAVAARTCKAFTEPALDVLWEHQSTVMNLLNCIPGEIWLRSENGQDRNYEVTLTRELLPEDWERPQLYARRVKTFTLHDWDNCPLEALEALQLCFPERIVFPNLRRLDWVSMQLETLPYVRMFLGPRLRLIKLSTCESIAHLSLLPILAAQCPLLAHVHVNVDEHLFNLRHGISSLVTGLNDLRTLVAPNVDRTALEHLAQLPNLDSLELVAQGAIPPSSAPRHDDPGFTALEYVDISVTDHTAAREILALMSSTPIKDLTITFPHLTPGRAIAECFALTAKHCSHSSLTTISMGVGISFVRGDTPTTAQVAAHVVRGPQLLPLLVFRNLTRIELATAVGFALDDTLAAEMAEAWPSAREICLYASGFAHIASEVTLAGLLPFAAHCPVLETLYLPLDASVVPKYPPPEGVERCLHRRLTTLGVAGAPISRQLDVAGFLSSVFPKLVSILTDVEDTTLAADDPVQVAGSERRMRWREVVKVLPLLRKVRAEERSWQKRKSV